MGGLGAGVYAGRSVLTGCDPGCGRAVKRQLATSPRAAVDAADIDALRPLRLDVHAGQGRGRSITREMTDAPTSFAELPLRAELLDALVALGYEEPTPIQSEAIPPLVDGRDLLGQAATGTGKTAAFALPILQRLEADRGKAAPAALILVPTRELAVQVSEAVHKYGRGLGAR